MDKLDFKNLHHAYFLVGNGEVVKKLFKFFESEKIKTSGNPDFLHIHFKTLTVENAEYIRQSQERKSFDDTKKIFIIEADFITEEAQNALLKVFEEPTAGTHFFIISPQDILLPTLRSRMQVIQGETSRRSLTDSILKLKLKDRLVKIKEMTDDEDKSKQDAIAFLNDIETELYAKKEWKALKICEDARQALYDRGAPVKMILEQVVLSV